MTALTCLFLMLWVVTLILGVVACGAAYRNGVRDGLFNHFLDEVKEIQRQEGWKHR